jgi:plasmid maintenance system antidote protein VapI
MASNKKLTVDAIYEIHSLWRDGKTQRHIAKLYGVAPNTISEIVNGARHKTEFALGDSA